MLVVVLTALEADDDIDIDVLAAQVSDNVEDLLAFDGIAATLFCSTAELRSRRLVYFADSSRT